MSSKQEKERTRILDIVKKVLDNIYPPKEICRFSKVCRGYRTGAFTCAVESEAKYYCGLYKLHEAAICQGKMKHMLSGTDFADFDV